MTWCVAQVTAVASGDVNGDGLTDLIACDGSSSSLALALGKRDGGFRTIAKTFSIGKEGGGDNDV